MAIDVEKASNMDLEKHKFRQSPKFPNKDVVATVLENLENDPVPTTDMDDVIDVVPFNYAVNAGQELTHIVGPNVKQVILKSRVISRIEIAFDAFASSPPLWSIPRGGFFQLSNLKLNKQFHIKAERDTVIEILHFI
jgi:hypothetical protein